MANKPDLTIISDDDGGVTLARSNPASGKDEVNPIDEETGDATFDDLDSRFTMPDPADPNADEDDLEELFPKAGKKKDESAEDDDLEDIEPPANKDDDDGAVDSDEEGEEEGEEEDDLPRGTGRGIKGRLAREARLREELLDDVADLRERLAQTEKLVNSRASDEEFEGKKTNLDAKIKAKRAELLQAKEDGKSEDEVRLIEELSDLKAELRTEESKHNDAKAAAEKAKTTKSPIVARKVEQWKRRHARFDRDSVFANFAIGVDRAIASEGKFNPETPEYYEELDRRIAERYPEEYKGQRKVSRARHPSQGFPREGARRRQLQRDGEFEIGKNGTVKLSKLHVRTMRTFQLDPDNPEHVRDFVRMNNSKGSR